MFLDEDDFAGRTFKGSGKNPYRTPVLSVNAKLNKKQKKGNRKTPIVTGIVVLAVIALAALGLGLKWIGGALLWNNDRYAIDHLDIRGGRAIREARIREYTGLEEGTNLFAVNISRIRRDVLEKVPNIKDFEIARVLPDTMVIRVSERTPLARVGYRGGFAIDEEGFVFVPRRRMQGLPYILGSEARKLGPGDRARDRILAALMVIDICGRHDISLDVSSIETDHSQYLKVRLANEKWGRLSWEGMGDDTKEAREALRNKLELWREALATPKGRRDSRFDLTYAGQVRSWP